MNMETAKETTTVISPAVIIDVVELDLSQAIEGNNAMLENEGCHRTISEIETTYKYFIFLTNYSLVKVWLGLISVVGNVFPREDSRGFCLMRIVYIITIILKYC